MEISESDIPLLFRFSILTIIFFISSCGKTTQTNSLINKKSSQNLPSLETMLLQQAKNIDIPVPVGFTPSPKLSLSNTNGQPVFSCYQGNLQINQVISFYKKSMELEGWKIQDFSTQQEGLLFCKKVSKNCALSIRPSHFTSKNRKSSQTDVYVFIQNKSNHSINQLDKINSKNTYI